MYLELEGLTKRFGDKVAVDGLDLGVGDRECVCLLGPSGCGKTTTLRMVGGFLKPDAGRVALDGSDVTGTDPAGRDIATVFQSYALFGHMDVLSNVAYGLACRRMKKAEREGRARDMLAAVRMEGYERALPDELSGGQRQRVALARALVLKPKVLLLDEPLSNLDAGLRLEMRAEIARIRREFGLAALLVTHDQEEAMALGDRVAVMRDGRIEQVAEPEDLYRRPANLYVAEFTGRMNRLTGADGRDVWFRSEDVRLNPDGPFEGTVTTDAFLGPRRLLTVDAAGTEVRISLNGRSPVQGGDRIRFDVTETPIGKE